MRHMRRNNRHLAGARPAFSLLEITLVLVIIGLMMGVAAVNMVGGRKRAAIRTTNATMITYKNTIRSYMVEHADTPPASLQTLVDAEYIEPLPDGTPTKDAWDEVIYYKPEADAQGHPFQLISKGPDKQPGTEDDINLWEIE